MERGLDTNIIHIPLKSILILCKDINDSRFGKQRHAINEINIVKGLY